MEKTRVVSHIFRATRKILENELIACFGLTAAITNKDEISELKQAQQERNSDLYRTSIQYTVLGSIHGKEVCLIPPQDVSLLLTFPEEVCHCSLIIALLSKHTIYTALLEASHLQTER